MLVLRLINMLQHIKYKDNQSSFSQDMAFKLVFSFGPVVIKIVIIGHKLLCLSCILSLRSKHTKYEGIRSSSSGDIT